MRVLVAVSGGVDSAVAAARLLDAGHDVTALHLLLAPGEAALPDARRVAEHLGIPLVTWDLRDRFREEVIEYFVASYAAGLTPNPCLRCNQRLKFGAVWERAAGLGYDALATGHYARVDVGADGPGLYRGVDPAKDQSYVLGVLTAGQVAHLSLPLGGSTKGEVRTEALARGLPVASKPDSLDICFIPATGVTNFLVERLGERPGAIVDADGTVVGTHHGAYRFTVGQRRGLRLGRPAPDGRPRFVTARDPASGTVTVGPHEALAVRTLETAAPSWTGVPRPGAWRGLARVRAHGEAMPATFTADDSGLRAVLDAPAHGIAAGQTLVCYDGDRVVGAAVLESAR